MCGQTDTLEATEWQRELPNSPGEWLWIIQWSCGCVQKSGIAWVPEPDWCPDGLEPLPNGLHLSWEGSKPWETAKVEYVLAWRKIKLPPLEWCEQYGR